MFKNHLWLAGILASLSRKRVQDQRVLSNDSMSRSRHKWLLGCALGIIPMGQTLAQDTTWTGATNSNWDTTSNNWTGAWVNGRTALFAGANQNPITVSPVSAFGMSFTSGTYTLNSGTITLVSGGSSASGLVAGEIRVASGLTANINSAVTGTVGFTKTGAGTLNLNGANTYTGGTTLAGSAGSLLRLGNTSALGAATNSLTINAGNTLDVNGLFAGGGVNVGALTGTGTITNNPASNLGGNLRVGNGNVSSTFDGTLQDAGGTKPLNLVKVGTGTLTLTGTNTHSRTLIEAGIVSIQQASNLGQNVNLEGGTLQWAGGNATYSGEVSAFGGSIEVTNSATTITQAGEVFGSSGFTKSGPGTLVLSNTSNNYRGTTLAAGILSVSSNSNLGNPSFGLTFNGGTLQVTGTSFTSTSRPINWGANGGGFDIASAANTFTVSQALAAGGSLTKLGAGTLVLSGNNLYTGGTNLNAGVLRVGSDANLGNSSGGLSFDGGTLQATSSFTTARGTMLNAAAGSMEVNTGTTLTHSGIISGAGSLTKLGAGTLNLNGANTYTGGTTLAGSAGSLLRLGNTSALGAATNSLTINAGNTLDVNGLFAGGGVNVGALTGTGTITSNPTAFTGGVLRVGNGNISSTFDGTLQDGGANKPLNVFKVGTGTLTLTGNNTYGKTSIEAGFVSVQQASNLGLFVGLDGGTLQWAGGNATYSGGITLLTGIGGTIEVTNSATTITQAGLVTGSGAITKSGPGTLVLSNTINNYQGGTTLAAGTLSVSSNSNLGNNTGNLTFNGGTLQVTDISFNSTGRTINWGANGGGFDIASAANTFTVSQALAAGGSLTKLGAGTLVLSSNNNYTGGSTVNAGTLQVGNGGTTGSLGTGLATINAGATLSYLRSTQFSLANSFAGPGTLNFLSTGVATQSSYILTGNNSLFAGTLQVGPGSSGNGARVVASNPNHLGTASVIVNNNSQVFLQAGTYSNNFTIHGNGWAEGAGNLGALRMDGGSTITGSVTLAGNSRIASSNTAAISGVISGGFGLEKTQGGTLTLCGNNTYTGSTLVSAGTLLINGNQTAANGTYDVSSGATLGGTGTIGRLVNFNGGTLSPGAPNGTGILTINGGVNFNAGSTFRVDLQGSVAGSGYDQLILDPTNFGGYLIFPNTQLIGDRLGSYQANFLDSFVILKNNLNTFTGTGTFTGLADGAFFDFDGQVFQIRYNVPNNYIVDPTGMQTGFAGITWTGDNGFGVGGSDNGGNIVIAAVPEPSTWALMLSSVSICGYVAYRRHRKAIVEVAETEIV